MKIRNSRETVRDILSEISREGEYYYDDQCPKLQGRLQCCASSKKWRSPLSSRHGYYYPMLIFKIQKRLSILKANQLQTVACAIDEDETNLNLSDLSEPELYNFVVDYIRSEQLRDMEDEGMSQLLFLHDMLTDLLAKEAEADNATPL
ncbi:hypothetical protein MHYP_G00100100 [Metynnis hypsauchen]